MRSTERRLNSIKAPDDFVRGFFVGGGNRELLAQVAQPFAPKIYDGTLRGRPGILGKALFSMVWALARRWHRES
jgi:hypothetical protein